jgi:S-methylmethionine-dependent homocysteine/selenocysteine methylase
VNYPLLLDGATGTELHRRGVNTGLPLWSANALLDDHDSQTLNQIHHDYLHAGADIITANTFRTHKRSLAKGGRGQRARELTLKAVAIAREAIKNTECLGDTRCLVAGSIAPLEDCYSPQLVPTDLECEREHSEMIQHLAESKVDIFLIETMNTIREAAIAAKAAARIGGIPVVVSFVCGMDGKLLSGESLSDAARAVIDLGVDIIGVNCVSTPHIKTCLDQLRSFNMPLIAYGNIGHIDERDGWTNTDAVDPEAYARYAVTWGAQIIGGCCGTTPEHIRQMEKMIHAS